MKRIILASASPQRRHLMDLTGLEYAIVPSKAQEITALTRGVAHLVKHNALIKARDVAARSPNAIVIGCDTVVYSAQKRLILKPKDLTVAKKNLKELMAKPHWVYSGLAVIDTGLNKTWTAVEKTKVFMRPLNDQSIERYHQLVNPLDKAGGFDIEGKGAMFIHRIEGCFYNVVGLPLSTLVMMLDKCGIKVL